MLRQKQHKRFINQHADRQGISEMLLSSGGHWYAQPTRAIVLIGNDFDNSNDKRPCYIHV